MSMIPEGPSGLLTASLAYIQTHVSKWSHAKGKGKKKILYTYKSHSCSDLNLSCSCLVCHNTFVHILIYANKIRGFVHDNVPTKPFTSLIKTLYITMCFLHGIILYSSIFMFKVSWEIQPLQFNFKKMTWNQDLQSYPESCRGSRTI